MEKDSKILIKKILNGNEQAAKLLYERYEQYWFRICLRYGQNRVEAQDMFQEGVIQLFKVLNKFEQLKQGKLDATTTNVTSAIAQEGA